MGHSASPVLQPEGSSPALGSPIALVCEDEAQISALSTAALDIDALDYGEGNHYSFEALARRTRWSLLSCRRLLFSMSPSSPHMSLPLQG